MLDQHDTDPDHASDPDAIDAHHNLHGNYPPQQYDPAHPPAGQGFGYGQQPGQSSHMPPPGQQQMTPQYEQQQQQQQQQHLAQGQQQQGSEGEGGAYASIPHMIDPNDPLLDADPFGLSASMHYPTSYSFDQGGGGRWAVRFLLGLVAAFGYGYYMRGVKHRKSYFPMVLFPKMLHELGVFCFCSTVTKRKREKSSIWDGMYIFDGIMDGWADGCLYKRKVIYQRRRLVSWGWMDARMDGCTDWRMVFLKTWYLVVFCSCGITMHVVSSLKHIDSMFVLALPPGCRDEYRRKLFSCRSDMDSDDWTAVDVNYSSLHWKTLCFRLLVRLAHDKSRSWFHLSQRTKIGINDGNEGNTSSITNAQTARTLTVRHAAAASSSCKAVSRHVPSSGRAKPWNLGRHSWRCRNRLCSATAASPSLQLFDFLRRVAGVCETAEEKMSQIASKVCYEPQSAPVAPKPDIMERALGHAMPVETPLAVQHRPCLAADTSIPRALLTISSL
jgi:hypothetical protein